MVLTQIISFQIPEIDLLLMLFTTSLHKQIVFLNTKTKKKNSFNPPFLSFNISCLVFSLARQSWVNLSKRGGKEGVFRELAGLLRGISRGQSSRKILRSSPATPRKTLSFRLCYSDLHSISHRFPYWPS